MADRKLGALPDASAVRPTDQLVYADMVADSSGGTGGNIPANFFPYWNGTAYRADNGKIIIEPDGLRGLIMGDFDAIPSSEVKCFIGSVTSGVSGFVNGSLIIGPRSSAACTTDILDAGGDSAIHVAANGNVGINTRLTYAPMSFDNYYYAGAPATLADSINKISIYSSTYGFGVESLGFTLHSNSNFIFRYSTTCKEQMRLTTAGHLHPGTDNVQNIGSASLRWDVIYAGTGSINTSDERAKKDVGKIPDEWLDAWAEVEWCRYKFKSGDRWHIGLVAQRVHKVFAAHNIDAFEIGLLCFDKWDAEYIDLADPVEIEPAVLDDNGKVIKEAEIEYVPNGKREKILEKGDRWGLRYEECLAIEAAWSRREIKRLRDLIKKE